MNELAVKLDTAIQQASLCDFSQLEQILNEAESRQQRNQLASTENVSDILSKIASGIAAKKLDTAPVARELGAIAISLAKMMTQKLVGNSEALQTERLTNIISEAMSRPEPIVRILVNPSKLDAIRSHFQECDELRDTELKSDANIAAEECRIELDTNSLVSSMENQLHEIESRLLELIDNV